MHELVGDRPDFKGDPSFMRGDNFAAVTWANRCGGARDTARRSDNENARPSCYPRGLKVRCKTYSRRSEHVSGRYFTLAPIRTSRQSEITDKHR